MRSPRTEADRSCPPERGPERPGRGWERSSWQAPERWERRTRHRRASQALLPPGTRPLPAPHSGAVFESDRIPRLRVAKALPPAKVPFDPVSCGRNTGDAQLPSVHAGKPFLPGCSKPVSDRTQQIPGPVALEQVANCLKPQASSEGGGCLQGGLWPEEGAAGPSCCEASVCTEGVCDQAPPVGQPWAGCPPLTSGVRTPDCPFPRQQVLRSPARMTLGLLNADS